MVAIGSCDICGDFCADDADDFRTAEYHGRLAERLHDCLDNHLGPWHDRRGRPLVRCGWCAELSDYFGTDNALDHTDCARCRAERPFLPRPAPRGWAQRQAVRMEPRTRAATRREWSDGARRALEAGLYEGLTSTEPADRLRVEHALRTYLGHRRVRIVWYDSPRALGVAFAEAVRAGGLELPLSGAELEPWSLWPMAPAALQERASEPYYLSGEPAAAGVVREFSLRAGAIASAVEDLASPDGSEVFPTFTAAGQFDILSRRQDVLDGFPGAVPIPDGGFLALMAELRRSAGPVLAFDRAFHVLDRPLALRTDAEMRLHCEDGPVVAYPDGSEVWALGGVVVSRDVVLHPERISVADIEREPNAEVRRVLVERFGAERLLREGGAELVDEDATGKLWRWQPAQAVGRRSEPIVMVEVVNSTAEPDGSFRSYFLRVPPDVTTAPQAVAWTFHLRADEYRPAQQT
ncbi:MAG: DUF6745 domain-containing protein [Candidatus Limnocylindrales bacterium]